MGCPSWRYSLQTRQELLEPFSSSLTPLCFFVLAAVGGSRRPWGAGSLSGLAALRHRSRPGVGASLPWKRSLLTDDQVDQVRADYSPGCQLEHNAQPNLEEGESLLHRRLLWLVGNGGGPLSGSPSGFSRLLRGGVRRAGL